MHTSKCPKNQLKYQADSQICDIQYFTYCTSCATRSHLLSFQFFIQGSCQLQQHCTGNGRICGALELHPMPLWRVVLGVKVTGQDQATLGWWVEGGNYVCEGKGAVGCSRRKPILDYFPACTKWTEGCFDMLWTHADRIFVSDELSASRCTKQWGFLKAVSAFHMTRCLFLTVGSGDVRGTCEWTHLLHSLAACRAWIPGNQERPQVPQPHLLQVGVRQDRMDLIFC